MGKTLQNPHPQLLLHLPFSVCFYTHKPSHIEMSEVQSRPAAPRGRGSARGGRGGFSSRGGRGGRGHATNGDKTDSTTAPIEDDGEVGQLKKKYGSKVTTIKEMFPDWTDEDVVFALQETDGDLETTVDRITDGTITQWGEVSKSKKDRSKSKVKEATTVTSFGDSTNQSRVSRGGRAGFDGARGGRGRATERGGRGGRGRAPTNGVRKENTVETSTPTVESTAWETAPSGESSWDAPKATEDSYDTTKPAQDSWSSTATGAAAATATTAAKVTSSVIPDGVKKSWASIFAPAPAPKKAPEPVVEKPAEPTKVDEAVESTAIEEPSAPEPEVQIPPSEDKLTEDNLEQLPDSSNPAPTATVASTKGSWDPRSAAATPYSNLQPTPQAIRPPTSGFQASAQKATGSSGRTASYQRRVLDQEEAVRMPGNREVERTAVQFGAFNLNGSGEEDVDGDREEAETRAQPPQHSPVAPRAALPPANAQAATVPESVPTPKQPAGLPAATHPTAAPGLPSPAPHQSAQATAQQGPQGNAQYSQYGRYGQAGVQESSLPPKPYDAFSQQAPSTQSPFEGYPSQPSQSQSQPQSGAFSSAPNEFSSYYTADPQQQRNAYNSYYQQQYGQQQGSQGQDGPASQQRGYPGYNGPQAENSSQFPQSAAQTTQSRYATAGEGQNSGHTTPNPVAQSQQPAASQGAQPQPGHQQQPQVGNYPYGHPYYQSPYYAAWNQYQQGYGGNYPGGPYGAKGGHQPYQGYGMSPAAPYEHTASPAAGGFGASSLHGRDSALGGLSEYGRAGSAQAAQTPQGLGGSGAFGGHDAFGRGSSYQGQGQQHYNSQQGAQPGTSDELKPFGESKAANGPSPSLQAGRPGSATNASSGSSLPPSQTQAGYGGYPAHLQQPGQGLHANQTGSGYGGLGGAGHQAGGQGHQNSQYGGYQGFGGNSYGNYGSQRGGWGGNYGH